ncbi:MAG: hypothetical protein ACO4CT_17185, partial [Planctomycetota bacterium]
VTRETFAFWAECPPETSAIYIATICEVLREQLPEEGRTLVYGDLTQITVADCKVHENEKEMLALVKDFLGL